MHDSANLQSPRPDSHRKMQEMSVERTGIVARLAHPVRRAVAFLLGGNRPTVLLISAAVISGLSTYAALTETPPFGKDARTVLWLLNVDLAILVLFLALIVRRMLIIFRGTRRGTAGSRLHVRLVLIFSLLAATPAIIMTIFSALFLHYGVESWFNQRIRTAVFESQEVAEAYLEEHQQAIRADTLAMANDIDREAAHLANNPEAFERLVVTQSLLRNLSEAIIFDRSGRVLVRSGMTFTMAFERLPDYAIAQADDGEVVVMTGGDDRVRALVKLNNFYDTYLFAGRMVDSTVLSHVSDTRRAATEYQQLEAQRSDLQVTITMIFVVVALLLVMAATWFGLLFARQLVGSIGALVAAADRVRAGDLTAQVPETGRRDEFDMLGRAFNRMTSQINQQRNELVTANRQLDHRRRFTETVLAGVSAGIMGIGPDGRITLANSSAAELLSQDMQALIGQNIDAIMPDLHPLLEQARSKPGKIAQSEIPWRSADDKHRTFLVRIAIEALGAEEEESAVMTFDDITELQSAQRKAAWADVARRIAHEIKNPLTPIQLSAERLRRKYLKQITEDREIFAKCTDTIIHHVGDIGRMVNEFSAFARMPEPVMREEDVGRHLRDLMTLQQEAHGDIRFTLSGLERIPALVDAQQIRQAFTNIVQNAIDSVQARAAAARTDGNDGYRGRIDIRLIENPQKDEFAIIVADNGTGLPKDEDPGRLTEPYVTHREKGTGLGLAIVKKIMEDHKGRIVLGPPEWMPPETVEEGATVSLILPLESELSYSTFHTITGETAA